MNSIESSTTIIANIVTIIGVIGLAAIWISHRLSVKQFHFTVMLSCIDRFQQLYPSQMDRQEEGFELRLRKYLDLTNEEFFYFENGVIPKVVIVEWMDSIIECLPIYYLGNEQPINYDFLDFPEIHDRKLLQEFPRLNAAMRINGKYDFSVIADRTTSDSRRQRRQVIAEILRNLNVKVGKSHFDKALLSGRK
ncbi:hypothetical protein [Marinoscillum luteum]|uniref:Uncharacterized protein n=1 Tax=Marinoscillum luteum TaxID=861051 RepID=A0ABW7NBN9_9BACT